MRKLILDALKAKFVGVSESILNRIAEKMAKTVTKEEDVATAVEGVTFQQLIDSEADRRSTEASQTAVSNYEKKHGLKDGQKVTGGEPTNEPNQPPTGGDMEAITAAVQAAIKPLQDEIATLKSGKIADTRKQRLDEVLGKAPASFKNLTEKNFSRMSFKDDEDFQSWLEEIKTDTEAAIESENSKGAVLGVPGRSTIVSKKEPTAEEVAEVAKSLNLIDYDTSKS